MSEPGLGKGEDNPLKDVQNILGFLLAGFAGVLGFIGLRSAEVSTVLRNDLPKATTIAVILFLAAIAAVSGVVISHGRKAPRLLAAVAFLALLGIGMIVEAIIPKKPGPSSVWACLFWSGFALIALAALALITSLYLTSRPLRKRLRWRKLTRIVMRDDISAQLICILASLTLLAISVYGAMRLEAVSQGTPAVQISASIENSAKATDPSKVLSAHVRAAKIVRDTYVGVIVLGLPQGVPLGSGCSKRGQFASTQCLIKPCRNKCNLIFSVTVPPDANGNIDYMLRDGLVDSTKDQDISVLALLCESTPCTRFLNESRTASSLDIYLSHTSLPSDKLRTRMKTARPINR